MIDYLSFVSGHTASQRKHILKIEKMENGQPPVQQGTKTYTVFISSAFMAAFYPIPDYAEHSIIGGWAIIAILEK